MTKLELDSNIVASSRATAFAVSHSAWPILVSLATLSLAVLTYLIFFNKDGMERVYVQSCTEAAASGNYSRAVDLCSAAIAHRDLPSPMRDGMLYRRAEAYIALGSSDKAITDLTVILEGSPADRNARYLRAEALANSGDAISAINDIKVILDSGAKDPKYYDLYAYLLANQGNFAEASTALSEGLRHHPDNILLLNRQANALLNLGMYEQVPTFASSVLQQDPTDGYALFSRAYAWIELMEYKKARSDLDTLLAHDPSHTDGWTMRAYANLKLGALDPAETDIRHAETSAWSLFVKERIWMDKGYSTFFTKPLSLAPDNADIATARLAAWVSGRRYLGEEGIISIQAEAKSIREGATLSLDGKPMLCLIYGALADFGAAQEICDEAVATSPKNGEAWRSRAILKLRLGLFSEALTDWNEAIALSSEDAIALFGQGYTLLLLNHEASGRSAIERARGQHMTVASYFDGWGLRPGEPPEVPEAFTTLP